MTNLDEKYMHECIKLAKKGHGKVAPNPMVGCVVLDKNGQSVSKGYHRKYGGNHAERDALLKLKNNEADGGTLYVNLEPCSHYGKTPPCTDLIIEKGIKRVVIGMRDANPVVSGIEKLEKAGISITTDILEKEAKFLNRVFIKNITQSLPYVVLKTATTMDGKIATRSGDSKWITSETAREEVYRMRKEFDCIMTTSNTIITDNPCMEHKFKCILDTHKRISSNARIYQQGEIYHATSQNTPLKNGRLDIKQVLSELYKLGIYNVFVEAGGTLAGSMLKDKLIDEIYQFIAPKILNDNDGQSCFNGNRIKFIADAVNVDTYSISQVGCDILLKSQINYR